MSDSMVVAVLPPCDICRYVDRPTNKIETAAYDGKTKDGPWANMCERHFKSFGIGLGTGLGQRLVVQA